MCKNYLSYEYNTCTRLNIGIITYILHIYSFKSYIIINNMYIVYIKVFFKKQLV